MSRTGQHPRGSILIVTIVLMLLLLVVGLGMVVRGQKSYSAVAQKQKYDASVSCADGARQMLLGQFRAFNVNMTSLTLNTTVNTNTYSSGHYNQFGIASVSALNGNDQQAFATARVEGMANRSINTPLGGTPYVMTVVCSDTTGQSRETEIEFFVRFGL